MKLFITSSQIGSCISLLATQMKMRNNLVTNFTIPAVNSISRNHKPEKLFVEWSTVIVLKMKVNFVLKKSADTVWWGHSCTSSIFERVSLGDMSSLKTAPNCHYLRFQQLNFRNSAAVFEPQHFVKSGCCACTWSHEYGQAQIENDVDRRFSWTRLTINFGYKIGPLLLEN